MTLRRLKVLKQKCMIKSTTSEKTKTTHALITIEKQ
jgi:hypothetical protein